MEATGCKRTWGTFPVFANTKMNNLHMLYFLIWKHMQTQSLVEICTTRGTTEDDQKHYLQSKFKPYLNSINVSVLLFLRAHFKCHLKLAKIRLSVKEQL